MRITGRWADWLALVVGTAVVVSYTWHGMLGLGMAALFLVGVLIVFLACLAIIHPELFVAEAAMVAAGLFLVGVPWMFAFTDTPAAAWTAWIGGAVAVVTGLVTLPGSTALYRRIVPPQPSGGSTS
ncbi:SPW repeat domain-containing protein [Streptomonospora litoralis]|uniref:SPW repeat-containing integral membrane domain-containing protein n=1 Tax=Streptomonospora litoralis TaxID=2498135 RepID=A0A4V0ZJ86_9ACTN|nr:SPW repeat protein [Streptomonospora litoralis]QBI52612.1 hypothetical protein EKD16_04010 [Streptomonospora litoralis]